MKKNTKGSENENIEKWYDKFSKKPKQTKAKKTGPKEFIKQKKSEPAFVRPKNAQGVLKTRKAAPSVFVQKKNSMFSLDRVPDDSRKIIENFLDIIQQVKPLNSRQLAKVPLEIRELSHELTDERSERKKGYMNETIRLSSYVRYYMWWNLVRLTRLFANLDEKAFTLSDNAVCLDIGSGPLTVVTALWLARPELRKKNLTWYCLDLSQSALSFGEEIYLSIAAKTLKDSETVPWKIVRVKGENGTFIKQKAEFITCANMFNELLQKTDMPPDFSAKKYCENLLGYAADKKSIFVVEPGVPASARLLSLMRDSFMRKGMIPVSPCPHTEICPMEGKRGGKWCNFAFFTDDAPAKLLKLSASADLPKERAVLSYLFVTDKENEKNVKAENTELRVTSDVIKLPGNKEGFYACSEKGLVLLVNQDDKKILSGDKIEISAQALNKSSEIDAKSGAVKIYIK